MATVSHYAMQPYPALYGDGSTQLSPSQYYVASNQHQLSQMYDKTKKTWSQRLKITKTEKSPSPLNELPDYSQSALSRSMKYAEPWLYGTVRGIPARPVHGQAIFTPMPSELAVVVCSCPEYLNGTKKEMKKASICKKCKGSRLPLAPIGGTVRLRPTSAPVVHAPRGSVGTVRLPSSSSMKSRPSILDPKNDPYDLMRRSRLLTPEPKAVSNEKPMKTRAKSTSPTRGRSRSRITRLAPEDPAPIANNNNGNSSNNRPRSATRTKQERWLDTMEHDPGGRRSILRCDINPYELISSKPHTNNEFAPDHDDMFHPSAMPETMAKSPIKVNYSNVKAIAGQRISLGETMTQRGDHLPYEQHKPKQGLSPAKHDGNGLSKIQKRTESFASNKDTELSGLVTQPKRPPRRKQETSSADEDNEMPERSTKAANELDTTSTMHSPTLSLSYISSLESSNTPRQGIKSILKRPSSVSSSSSDIDAKNNDLRTDNLGAATTIDIPGSHAVSLVRAGEKSSYDRTAGTQFYLPLPQTRKKVQFMVENRIIHHEVEDESLGRRMDPPAAWQTNNEQSFKDANGFRDENKSKQQQILDLLHQEQDEREKRAAAVAIAKDDSKKMASNPTQNCVIVVNQEQKNGSIMPPTEKQNGEWGGLNGQANIDKESTMESRFSSRKGSSLRRTHSARSTNTTTVLLNFNDTMALRIKNIRPDSRNIFPQNGRDAILRPKEQPPLPPQNYCSAQIASPASGLLSSQQNTKTSDRHAADRNPSLNGFSQQDNDNRQQMESDSVTDDGEGQPARPPRQTNRKISWQENGVVTIKNESDNPREENNGPNKENTAANESLSAKDELNLVSIPTVALKLEQVSQTIAAKKSEKERMLQAQREIFNGTRLFGNQNNKNGQKTVVRVAPFSTASSEIHRLKIRHEDENNFANIAQKKTSILINGDDCYSTVNVNNDTPLYQSSVVVTDGTCISPAESLKVSSNTVTINVSSPRTPEEEIIYKNNKINTLLNLNTSKAVIPITGEISGIGSSGDDSNPSSPLSDGDSSSSGSLKRGRTLITLDFDSKQSDVDRYSEMLLPHEEELVKILRNPVEAVKRNLIPHVCGKTESNTSTTVPTTKTTAGIISNGTSETLSGKQDRSSFIGKLLEDPTLSQLAEGLESEVVVKLIENSLKRLKDSRTTVDTSGTKDNDDMNKLIDMSLQKIKEERIKLETKKRIDPKDDRDNHDQQENESNRGSISSGNSYGSANYDLFEFDNNESDCYQSCSSEMTTEDDANSTKSKFYQMLVDATLSEIEISTSLEDDLHHYESIRLNCDPIYEEISEVPPPLPLSPPPLNDPELEKKNTRSMFEGASKYDILSYLVDAKERGIVREESYEYNFGNTSDIIVEEEIDTLAELAKNKTSDVSSRMSHLSMTSDSSEDTSLTSSISEKLSQRRLATDIERNDSGVGSETSKSSRSKYQNPAGSLLHKNSPIHLCEDCDGPVETQITDSGVMYAPLVCRKCGKKRAERKEIITEIVETEEKYGRDLQIILEEFCQPMLVAGLLTQEQLSAIFLNTEELLENNQTLAERMRDTLDIALEQGDDDLLTVNVGKVFLEATPMLHAFESYCVRQASASLLLANLEKDKELLRIFLRVSQMENAVLRRMNLNSFLMVPVQRVTKYPLLLARLYKVTPAHLEGRALLKQAQEKIELHLNHMNQEAKDVPTKLWRRISSSSPNRRSSCEIDMINIKLRKMAIDILEWNHDEVRFAMEGKLLFTQPTDSNWKKGRTIKLTHVNALLVTNGKPSANYKPEKASADQLNFSKHTGIREASLLLVKEKCGRYTLIREPLYLDRCVVCTEADWDDYFEVHEISSKDTYIFKAEDAPRTKQWYTQLQYHGQGMGAWRKRRNALANIMINGMLSRT